MSYSKPVPMLNLLEENGNELSSLSDELGSSLSSESSNGSKRPGGMCLTGKGGRGDGAEGKSFICEKSGRREIAFSLSRPLVSANCSNGGGGKLSTDSKLGCSRREALS